MTRVERNQNIQALAGQTATVREDAVPVVEHESVTMVVAESFTELLPHPVRGWMRGHLLVENLPDPHLITNTYRVRQVTVTGAKNSHATIAAA